MLMRNVRGRSDICKVKVEYLRDTKRVHIRLQLIVEES